jgi:hypothetical protein
VAQEAPALIQLVFSKSCILFTIGAAPLSTSIGMPITRSAETSERDCRQQEASTVSRAPQKMHNLSSGVFKGSIEDPQYVQDVFGRFLLMVKYTAAS